MSEMKRVAIVGHEETKFTLEGRCEAHRTIGRILGLAEGAERNPVTVVSGGCHLGGIDIWAEQAAGQFGCGLMVHKPAHLRWEPDGYKARNLEIAKDCDECHVIVVDRLPPDFKGMTHPICYHCKSDTHVKSGGCWTGLQAQRMGKPTFWYIVRNR